MRSDILPKVIFGTSALGNLYKTLSSEKKCNIIREAIFSSPDVVVFDSAGKYGAGLALESLGQCLDQLKVEPEKILISNKLGWYRIPLLTEEPTFEPGVWCDLKHDAIQKISYEGILECYEQGNTLLGNYSASMVSVHDPDEYLDAAADNKDRETRYKDILNAYRALLELKQKGSVVSVGVGAKKWEVIRRITGDVELDWVMIANSMTIHNHPRELLAFMNQMKNKDIKIINSAVFNAGFLVGGGYYNYKLVTANDPEHLKLFDWRRKFNAICEKFRISPAQACISFALSAPGVTSIALSTTNEQSIQKNIQMASASLPNAFWQELKGDGLVDKTYDYLNL